MRIAVHDATTKTASVEIKSLTISGNRFVAATQLNDLGVPCPYAEPWTAVNLELFKDGRDLMT